MKTNDTITAISTPSGVGGIAVVRISGPKSRCIAEQLIGKQLQDHQICYGRIAHKGTILDEVVATYFMGPRSYTGEDVVEISGHGSLYIQKCLLGIIIDNGARLAEPGEFTLRAFLNGKMDLSQSEAVADLIDSTSAAQHQLAVNQLRGGFSSKLRDLRRKMVDLTSLLELELDFSDEDIEFADREKLYDLLHQLQKECTRLVDSFQMGNAIKNGIPVAIIGRPNVGKSTLLNALLEDDRAIVSDIPGTTRDTIEDTVIMGGILFRFVDTAGIRKSDDAIESAGIERSFSAARKARIILLVTDKNNSDEDFALLKQHVDIQQKHCISILNKCDNPADCGKKGDILRISAKNGLGISQLKETIISCCSCQTDDTLLTNARHYEAMQHMLEALNHVEDGLNAQLPADLVVIDIQDALYHLGTITGEITSDEVLGNIFSRFCIGK